MNPLLQTSTRRLQAGRALAAAFALAFTSGALAQTYTWVGASGKNWITATDWSPNTTGSVGPSGSGVTVVNGDATSTTTTLPTTVTVGTIDSGAASWGMFGPGTNNLTNINVTTINQGGTGTLGGGDLTFRDNTGQNMGTSEGQVTLDVSTINITSGILLLGASGATSYQELYAISGTPTVNMEGSVGSAAQLSLNVLTNYTLGVVDMTGTGTVSNTIVLIANSDTQLTPYPSTVTATVAGLEGTSGTLTIYGASGTEGGTASLVIANSTGTTYTSSAVLSNGEGSGADYTQGLSLTVDLTGGGTQILTGTSTYTGTTTISAGTLQLGSGVGGSGAGSINDTSNIVDDGTLAYDRSGAPNADAYVISGTGALSILGSGTITLTGANTYGGTTTISGGTLQIGNGGTTGTLGTGGNVIDSTALVFNRSDTAYSVGNAISGTGTVTQAGTGAITFTGNNTYSGGTSVTTGTLYVNNTAGNGLGTGTVTVAGGAMLAGTGTITNAITVNGTLGGGNATLAGNSAATGTLTLGSGTTLTIGSGGGLAATLGTSSTLVAFGGPAANSVIGLSNLTLNLTEGAGFSTGQIYTIIGNGTTATSGSYTVDAVDLDGTALTGGTYTLAIDSSGDYTFEDSAVPEPADYALLLGAVVLGCALVRRRRQAT